MRIPFAWRGWPFGANLIRFGEGDPLANPIRLERVTLWCESHSLWRGWPSWCESHSLGEGDAIDANSIRRWQGESFEANPIRCGEGTPLRRIPFSSEEGTPLKRIPFAVEREVPWGEYHSLGEGNPLDRGNPQQANPIRLEETPRKRNPFAVERGVPWGECHSLDQLWEEGHLDRVDSSMKRILFALETGTPMVQSPILGIWCCEGDLLDANRLWVAKVIPVKIPVFRRRESPLTGSSTVARRVASYESIRSVRANGNCDEDDRWSRSLNANGLEGDRGLDARRGPWSDDECGRRGWASDGETTLWEAKAGEGPLRCEEEA